MLDRDKARSTRGKKVGSIKSTFSQTGTCSVALHGNLYGSGYIYLSIPRKRVRGGMHLGKGELGQLKGKIW